MTSIQSFPDPSAARATLVGSRSWSATPWDYSSMVYFQWHEDGTGILLYGYGQTIYAKLNFKFEVLTGGRIQIDYLDSPSLGRFAGFSPTDSTATKILEYSLTQERAIFTESVTGSEFSFDWLLRFDHSPFPSELIFPYKIPDDYYGYREAIADNSTPDA